MDAPCDADKDAWRVWARRRRRRLDRDGWSASLVRTLRTWPRYLSAETVLTYLAFGSEADLAALQGDERGFAVPRVLPGEGRLALHALAGPLVRHALGMQEPTPDAPAVDQADVDLVLVPGLAFDRHGGRLGYGGGYYDRLLAGLAPGVPRVGVAHPDLVVDALPVEPHDVRMSHLLLPGRIVPAGQEPGITP